MLGADGAILRLLRGDQLVAVGQRHTARQPMMPQKRAWGRVLLGGRRSRIGCLWCLTSRPILILTRSGSNARRRPASTRCCVSRSVVGTRSWVLSITSTQRRVFTDDEAMVLSAYAEQVAIAIEHARLLAAEEERTAVLERTNLILRNEITERQRIEAERERPCRTGGQERRDGALHLHRLP